MFRPLEWHRRWHLVIFCPLEGHPRGDFIKFCSLGWHLRGHFTMSVHWNGTLQGTFSHFIYHSVIYFAFTSWLLIVELSLTFHRLLFWLNGQRWLPVCVVTPRLSVSARIYANTHRNIHTKTPVTSPPTKANPPSSDIKPKDGRMKRWAGDETGRTNRQKKEKKKIEQCSLPWSPLTGDVRAISGWARLM